MAAPTHKPSAKAKPTYSAWARSAARAPSEEHHEGVGGHFRPTASAASFSADSKAASDEEAAAAAASQPRTSGPSGADVRSAAKTAQCTLLAVASSASTTKLAVKGGTMPQGGSATQPCLAFETKRKR